MTIGAIKQFNFVNTWDSLFRHVSDSNLNLEIWSLTPCRSATDKH